TCLAAVAVHPRAGRGDGVRARRTDALVVPRQPRGAVVAGTAEPRRSPPLDHRARRGCPARRGRTAGSAATALARVAASTGRRGHRAVGDVVTALSGGDVPIGYV